MALKITKSLVDDLDGSAADRNINFSVDGVNYEIDLSSKNFEAMLEALKPYTSVARKVGGRRQVRRPAASGTPGKTALIREWAAANGKKVADRGRIPADIVAAYEAAH